MLLAAAALLTPASAWGPETHKMLCREAVSTVWGEQALRCLNDSVSYCLELKNWTDGEMSQRCLDAYASGVEVHPATAPDAIFNDVENHYNYDDCPLKWVREQNRWICDLSGNPAGAQAQKWFNISRHSERLCSQVRAFCTGGFYYASSRDPLLRVNHLTGCFGDPLSKRVDEKLLSNETGWEVKLQCVFKYMKPFAGRSLETTQHQTFIVDEDNIEAVESNLTVQGFYVRNPELMPETTTTLAPSTTTSTTVTTTSTLPPSTTTLPPTTTSATIPPSTSTLPPTTVTTVTSTTATLPAELNQSLQEIDVLFEDVMASVNKSREPARGRGPDFTLFALIAVVLLASAVMLVYVYSRIRRPTVPSERRVVLPPSARRRMRTKR